MSEKPGKLHALKAMPWGINKKWGHKGGRAFPMKNSTKLRVPRREKHAIYGEQVIVTVIDKFMQCSGRGKGVSVFPYIMLDKKFFNLYQI